MFAPACSILRDPSILPARYIVTGRLQGRSRAWPLTRLLLLFFARAHSLCPNSLSQGSTSGLLRDFCSSRSARAPASRKDLGLMDVETIESPAESCLPPELDRQWRMVLKYQNYNSRLPRFADELPGRAAASPRRAEEQDPGSSGDDSLALVTGLRVDTQCKSRRGAGAGRQCLYIDRQTQGHIKPSRSLALLRPRAEAADPTARPARKVGWPHQASARHLLRAIANVCNYRRHSQQIFC